MNVLERLQELGGAGRRSQLVASAADRRELRRHLADGVVEDLGRGWVAVAGVGAEIAHARRFNATLTCVSAVSYHGLDRLSRPTRAHVAIPRSRGVSKGHLTARVHRESLWTPPQGPVPLAPIGEVLARVLRCQPAREAVVVVDSALNKGLITAEEIGRSLNGPGSAAARSALEQCHPRSRSPIETLARLELTGAGLIAEAGAVIERVGEVDLLVERRVVVECDGFRYHSGTREFREDRRRDRELVAQGFLVLRFTRDEIIDTPAVLVEAVQRGLRVDRDRSPDVRLRATNARRAGRSSY